MNLLMEEGFLSLSRELWFYYDLTLGVHLQLIFLKIRNSYESPLQNVPHKKCMRNDEELKVVEVSLQAIYDTKDSGFGS